MTRDAIRRCAAAGLSCLLGFCGCADATLRTPPDETGARLVLFATDHDRTWRTDGTAAGTMQVSDAAPGVPTAGATRFFEGDDAEHGYELWKTDATAAGTVFVKDINPGPNRTGGGSSFLHETPAGTIALPPLPATFAAGTPSLLYGLWQSDIRFNARLSQIATVGDRLFFLAGRETSLWTSDGTAEGTRVVEGIPAPASIASAPFSLTPFEGALYFIGEDAEHGRQLWRVDGAGPALRLTSVEGQVARAYDNWNQQVIGALGGLLLFPASGTGRTTELWGFRTR